MSYFALNDDSSAVGAYIRHVSHSPWPQIWLKMSAMQCRAIVVSDRDFCVAFCNRTTVATLCCHAMPPTLHEFGVDESGSRQ